MTTTFKAGDKVRVLSTGYTDKEWIGVEGIVQGTGLYANQYKVKLTDAKGTGRAEGYVANLGGKLELVEPSFTFADIQVGDTIRRTQTFKGGATEVREGIVTKQGSWYVSTADDSYILAYDSDDYETGATLELLNRPEPEPVKADWETAKAGDRLVVKGDGGTTRVLTKQADGLWGALLIREHAKAGKGILRHDNEIRICFSDPAFSKDGKYEFIPAS